MENNDLLKIFFDKKFEKKINEKMLSFSYEFETNVVLEYINSIIEVNLESFVKYILKNIKSISLSSNDIIQFSNFEVCTSKICSVIKKAGDTGFTVLEIGKMLQDDGINRLKGADVKYGENHSKTACQLGLLYKLSNKFFLTCLGYLLNDLDDAKKAKLLNRLVLRNSFIQQLICNAKLNKKVYYAEEAATVLKQTTIKRRRSNVRILFNILKNNSEVNLDKYLSNIII